MMMKWINMIKLDIHLFLNIFAFMEHPRTTALRTLSPEECTPVHMHTNTGNFAPISKGPRAPKAELDLKKSLLKSWTIKASKGLTDDWFQSPHFTNTELKTRDKELLMDQLQSACREKQVSAVWSAHGS